MRLLLVKAAEKCPLASGGKCASRRNQIRVKQEIPMQVAMQSPAVEAGAFAEGQVPTQR